MMKISCGVAAAALMASAAGAETPKTHPPGVPGAQAAFSSLTPSHTFTLGGTPDWMVLTSDAVWIANAKLKAVQRIDPKTNRLIATIAFPDAPCSGLAAGFGSLWVPLCGNPATLARVDLTTNMITATLPVGPADSEGGVAASPDSIWIVTDKEGTVARIDPRTNAVATRLSLPPGSFNPLYANGLVWVTGFESSQLIAVDPKTDTIAATVPTGSHPRFLTTGAGSVWTLNQGDGTITRIDSTSRRATATIAAGIPGEGGEIHFGGSAVWATLIDVPLTRIDVADNRVTRQWVGRGGDSVRFGFDSVWLTDYRRGLLWRIPSDAFAQ